MKAKWVFPFMPCFSLGLDCLHPNLALVPIETKIFHVVGILLLVVILLWIIKPWVPDEPKS